MGAFELDELRSDRAASGLAWLGLLRGLDLSVGLCESPSKRGPNARVLSTRGVSTRGVSTRGVSHARPAYARPKRAVHAGP